MNPERWQQVSALYHTALGRERAALLVQADPDVRREVESLLAKRSGDGPLDQPAWNLVESAPLAAVAAQLQPNAEPPYRRLLDAYMCLDRLNEAKKVAEKVRMQGIDGARVHQRFA